MKTRGSVVWWTLTALCTVSPLIRLFFPQQPSLLLRPAQFSFGVLASMLTGFTIEHLAPKKQVLHIRAALIFSLILAAVIVWRTVESSFAGSGGWVLLPIVFLGPILMVRKKHKGENN